MDQSVDIDLSQAIRFVRQAWNGIMPATIQNCWNHVNILSDRPTSDGARAPSEDMLTQTTDVDYGNIFRQMATVFNIPPEAIRTAEFESIDAGLPTGEELTDDEIVNLVGEQQGENPDESDGEETTSARLQAVVKPEPVWTW